MREDRPVAVTQSLDTAVTRDQVDASQVLRGEPRAGSAVLTTIAGAEVGVWEMTAGAMTDIEVDEVFVVVEGDAELTVLVDGRPSESYALSPGSVCRLTAGTTTLWEVPRRLRKVYLSPSSPPIA